MNYKDMNYHADYMIKELVRVYIMTLLTERKIDVNAVNGYTEKDIKSIMSKVKKDFNISIDEGIDYYIDYFKNVDEMKNTFVKQGFTIYNLKDKVN